jgi:hypothetical protein
MPKRFPIRLLKRNRRSLHYATPDFLLMLVALANFMRLSLMKAAHVVVSGAAKQEIRVSFGRDDKGEGDASSCSPIHSRTNEATLASFRLAITKQINVEGQRAAAACCLVNACSKVF